MRGEPDEQRRASRIRAFDVLEKPARRDLVAVVHLAALVCDVPLATINLLTETEHHQIATYGFEGSVRAIDESLCVTVLHEDAPVIVADMRADPRFRDHPMVNGDEGDMRFFAAWRLVTHDGVPIGTLCVSHDEPRHLDAAQTEALGTLSERVVDILELSLRTRELSATLVEVEAVRSELEQSNERLASFASQVSHDLKTPLTSMALSLSLIREELASTADTEALPLLDRAISASTRMAALIDDVLAFARLGGILRHDDVDLDQVLRDVRTDLVEPLEGVTFEVGDLPVVSGNEVQLRALLQNLVENAAKYADPARPAVVRVSGRRTEQGWRLEITDNGRGVPASELGQLFDPMTRAQPDPAVDGHGIGLATCRRIVDSHGGRIGLENALAGGTTAWFELPD
ncbi:MAG: GAF domain-containing sensor histidine kinase [Nocardioides sp.]|nr:GAF domain-containing sensor histidine kinase [Nocardioides sp.]